MRNGHSSTKDAGASLDRAKRIFLINVGFFICLSVVVFFFFATSNEEDSEPEAPPPIPEKAWTLPELAYLKGEMQALREPPGSMPAYEEEWVRNVARKEVLRDPLFEGQSESSMNALIDEYFKAYTKRFDEYYDPGSAKEFGYRIGVKFNPKFSASALSHIAPQHRLDEQRTRIEEAYNIQSEAEWRLFCRAFQLGFNKGFPVVKEGVTVQNSDYSIKLFDD